ncbi:MAG TPA: hypothetical protein VHQ65_09785 [Thermoanaerobaculia bacterium]|nr:hypothetical protein [Thermoanaerobaculia bacterium]
MNETDKYEKGTGGDGFPPRGTDLVRHDLRVDILAGGDGGEGKVLETLDFEGRMLLERGDPYTNEDGVRQVDFVVLAWEAIAWSRVLGSDVVYRSSGDDQPVSRIVAETKDADYPAYFTFNVVFDAFAGGRLVHRGHHGRPEGGGFHRVPPVGDRELSPTITTFERQVIKVDAGQHGGLVFRPRDCNDQESRTLGTSERPHPALAR